MFFGMSAWTPRTMSTTWVTRKLTAMLHRAYASSSLILAWAARNLIALHAARVIAACRSLSTYDNPVRIRFCDRPSQALLLVEEDLDCSSFMRVSTAVTCYVRTSCSQCTPSCAGGSNSERTSRLAVILGLAIFHYMTSFQIHPTTISKRCKQRRSPGTTHPSGRWFEPAAR